MSTEDEVIWKDIEGYEGLYQVSNKGKIKSFYSDPPKILSKAWDKDGYHRACLTKNGGHKTYKVHRLVAEAFIHNPENKPQVNHLDGDKENNHVNNLEWCTCSENHHHAYNSGIRKKLYGKNKGTAKLSNNDVIQIRNTYRFGCFKQKEIADAWNVSIATISRIVNNKERINV